MASSSPMASTRSKPRMDYKKMNEFGFDLDHSTPRSIIDAVIEKSDACEETAVDIEEEIMENGFENGMLPSDDELNSLEVELQKLQQEKLDKMAGEKIRRKQRLLQQISEAKVGLSRLESEDDRRTTKDGKGRVDGGRKRASGPSDKQGKAKARDNSLLMLEDLRAMKALNKVASKSVSKVGLGRIVESDSDTDSSSEEESSSSDLSSDNDRGKRGGTSKSKKRSHKRGVRSGIKAKNSERVDHQEAYPHAALQFQFASKPVKFRELKFSQFVAGELEIITNGKISKVERNARLSLLKKIAYYQEDYSWEALLDFYAAWVKKIETGRRVWEDDPSELEMKMLFRFAKPAGSKQKDRGSGDRVSTSSPDVWYCANFQRNRCEHKSSHFTTIRGQLRNCLHICSSCWRKDGSKQSHPECSVACPNSIGKP
jgi:hypothetical protein